MIIFRKFFVFLFVSMGDRHRIVPKFLYSFRIEIYLDILANDCYAFCPIQHRAESETFGTDQFRSFLRTHIGIHYGFYPFFSKRDCPGTAVGDGQKTVCCIERDIDLTAPGVIGILQKLQNLTFPVLFDFLDFLIVILKPAKCLVISGFMDIFGFHFVY